MKNDTQAAIVVVLMAITGVGAFIWLLYGTLAITSCPSPTDWHGFVLYISQTIIPLLTICYLTCGLDWEGER